MKIGYGRVSTKHQERYGTSLAEQKKELTEAGAEVVYCDAYSGKTMHRPEFDKLISMLKEGDELIVCKLDRLARTVSEGSAVIRDLVARGVRVNILNMSVVDDTPMGKMMVNMLLAFAEFERDTIVERTQTGKAAAKAAKGEAFKEGRPAAEFDKSKLRKAKSLQSAGKITAAEAAKMCGLSRSSYYKYCAAVL